VSRIPFPTLIQQFLTIKDVLCLLFIILLLLFFTLGIKNPERFIIIIIIFVGSVEVDF